MEWVSLLAIPFAIAAVWFSALLSTTTTYLPHYPNNTSILLVIAHPDDEAMFFAPTLLSLTTPHLKNDVQVLCLSIGDADGIGVIRKDELVESCKRLGVPTPKVVSLDMEGLKDAMGVKWDKELVAQTVEEHVSKMVWRGRRSVPEIVLTFDEEGVSGHGNHISVLEGVEMWVEKQNDGVVGEGKGVKLYTLTSVPLWRKYLNVLDFPLTYWQSRRSKGDGGKSLVFVNTWEGFSKARAAMTQAHVSQMRWFRWGWIWLSRYMVVNDFVLRQGGRRNVAESLQKQENRKEL